MVINYKHGLKDLQKTVPILPSKIADPLIIRFDRI